MRILCYSSFVCETQSFYTTEWKTLNQIWNKPVTAVHSNSCCFSENQAAQNKGSEYKVPFPIRIVLDVFKTVRCEVAEF